jgi:hypothetical protein
LGWLGFGGIRHDSRWRRNRACARSGDKIAIEVKIKVSFPSGAPGAAVAAKKLILVFFKRARRARRAKRGEKK